MTKLSEISLVSVSVSGKINEDGTVKVNKHGLQSLFLKPLAGTMPNRNFLDGTVAERSGISAGKTYLVQFDETEADKDYGRQFDVTLLGTPSMLEIIQLKKELGLPKVITVDADEIPTDITSDRLNQNEGDL
jgi:hypothetical protein